MAAIRSYVSGALGKLDKLDPTGAASKITNKIPSLGGYGKLSRPKEVKDSPVDLAPSEKIVDVRVEHRHRPEKTIGSVTVEVLQAGGWARTGLGDTFSSEDVFALIVCDGGVGRTDVMKDVRAPAWAATDRRAFRFEICDAGATLFCGLFDFDSDSNDDPIGRCALALRSLAPGATYDAWLPLSLRQNEDESVANATRALVCDQPLAKAATANELQKASRGAVRLRITVTWRDGGGKAARSALTSLLGGGGKRRYVAVTNDKSGRILRENVRFCMYGEGGCPVNPHNEPFSTKRLSDHVGELTRLAGAACSRHAVRLVALIAYTRPFRSVLALIAWCTSVASPARIPGWFMLFAFLDLMDALGGARLPRDTSFSAVLPKQPPKPILARPQLSFGTWLRACLGLGVGAAPKSCDRGKTYSLAAAHRVAEDVAIDRIRAKRVAPPAVDEEEELSDHDDDAPVEVEKPGKCMKSFSSYHPLAPFLRPVQHGILALVKISRAFGALFDGRDDPVATATLAFVCLLCAGGCFFYSEIVHGYVAWAVAWVQTLLLYGIGVALFGPQNYFLAESARKKRDDRRKLLASAAFDDKGFAAYKIQRSMKLSMQKKKEAAAALKRAEEEAASAAEADRVAAEEAAAEEERRKSIAKQERELKELKARWPGDTSHINPDDHGVALAIEELKTRLKGEPVVATKDQGKLAFGASPPSVLSLSEECDKFLYETKGKEKKIKLLKLTSVSSIDPRKPKVLKFATESKSYKFEFEDEKDAAVFAAGLRALAPAEATRGSITGKQKKDFLRVKVPTKPLGFLAASTVERDPARPEAHRSAVAAAAPLVPKDKAV